MDDQSISTVPIKIIDLGLSVQPDLSSVYDVKWTDRRKYSAEVLAIGMFIYNCMYIIYIYIYNYI